MTQPARNRIAILANCTPAALTMTLRRYDAALNIMCFPIFPMTPTQLQDTADLMDRVHHDLTMVHDNKFSRLATAVSVLVFSGQQPDMAFLQAAGRRIGDGNGPLSDYSSLVILRDVQRGSSATQTVNRYVSGESIACLDIRRLWAQSLDRLRQTEKTIEITISDAIADAAARGEQLFLSFNHLIAPLIAKIYSQFLTRVQDRPVTVAPLADDVHVLASGAF